MRQDSRLSVALHVLLHMSELGETVTSETLGPMLRTNPVALRRTLAGLREAGIVRSEKGHGGGWSVARDLREVTLGDVYDALGSPPLFGIGPHDDSAACPIERAVNDAVGGALRDAESLFLARLRSVAVESMLAGGRQRGSRRSRKGSSDHG